MNHGPTAAKRDKRQKVAPPPDSPALSSLEAYAATVERVRGCLACELPPEILAELASGRARRPTPTSWDTMAGYVRAKLGSGPSAGTIKRHFHLGHTE